jgi:hypothetical protein
MLKTEQLANLSAALALAQAELKNPHFDAVNPHFKSQFASLGAIRESVIPAFTKHGLSITQWPVSEEGKAGCRTHLAHASGEWMEEVFLIPVDKHNAHGYASAVTYSKRISMMSIAGVVGDTDDDGNAAVGDNVKGEKPEKPESTGTYNAKKDAFERMPKDEQDFLREKAAKVSELIKEGRAYDGYGFWLAQKLDADEMVAIQHLWTSGERTELKKAAEEWKVRENAGAREQHRQNRQGTREAA